MGLAARPWEQYARSRPADFASIYAANVSAWPNGVPVTISKKSLAVGLALMLVAAGALYFAMFSPKSTGLSYSVAQSSLSSTETQTVRGEVTPTQSGRLVVVELGDGSSWVRAGTTTTDSAGTFELSFPMTVRGEMSVRVRVEAEGRYEAVTAKTKTVRVLEPTQIEAQIPRFARADRALRIAGRVTPAGARTVHAETSTDGQNWVEAGQTTARAGSGKFSVSAARLNSGTVQVRVTVDETETSASVIGKARSVSVEDYKAAGRRYLAIATPANKALDAWDAAAESNDLTRYKAASAKASRAKTIAARQFRAYAYWPREVKGYIALLAKSATLYADFYNRLAHVKTIAETYAISWPELPKGANNAAALTRAALGLPKRDN